MTHPPELRAIAWQMKAAQDEARQIEPFTSRRPGFDLPAAYEVAQLIHQARLAEGERAVGRKIGFTNAEMWALYGVREPVWAHLYDRTVVHVAGQRAVCALGGFTEPKIEPEVVLHFCSAPPAGADAAAVLACVDWVAHGIEVVQSHFPGWSFRAADTVADAALHATLLVGEPQAVARLGADAAAALERFGVVLSCDGAVRERGRGSNVLGSPLTAVAHLIAVLTRQPHPLPLQSGEIVTTGTLTAALPISAGETWRTVLDGIALPGLEVEFVA